MDGVQKDLDTAGNDGFPMLKVAINVNFITPTFPRLEMFLVPAITIELIERWLSWFEAQLNAFIQHGTPFFASNKIVLFPDRLPYGNLGLPIDEVQFLGKLHSEICSLARMAVVMEANNRQGNQVAAEQAVSHIGKALALLQKYNTTNKKTSCTNKQVHLGELLAKHEQWFAHYMSFMGDNLESGNFPNEKIRAFGNYRQCPISQWIYEEENQLWFNGDDQNLLLMETNHKHFHAMTHMEALVAAQLRRKGLNSLELFRLKELVSQRLTQLEEAHQTFINQFRQTYLRIVESEHALPPHKPKQPLPFIPWDSLKKDVAEWKDKIMRYKGPTPDRELEESLSHAGCPTGQRIENALSDPSLYFLNEFGLKLLDHAHMQFHVTGHTIYTLCQLGFPLDAYALFNVLHEEEKDLLEHLKRTAPLLKISNAA